MHTHSSNQNCTVLPYYGRIFFYPFVVVADVNSVSLFKKLLVLVHKARVPNGLGSII